MIWRGLARRRCPRNRNSSTPRILPEQRHRMLRTGGAAAIRAGLLFLVVVLGLGLLLLLHDRLAALERAQQVRAAGRALSRRALPHVHHRDQDAPTLAGR